jgi:hypothetical protein
MKRKLKKLKGLVDKGETTLSKVEEMFRSWSAAYWPYMSKKQRETIVSLYRQLFNGGLDKWMKKRNML